jgi:enamine deaminase RidA (YjgF/YER057c/UK114 family)
MPRQALNPAELFNSLQYGFSQIAIGQGRKIVTISGQVGWDENEQIVGGDDFKQQTLKAFRNLDIAIRAAGGTLADILSLRIYIVASAMSQSGAVREGLQQFFPQSPPTATWIGVPCLADPDFLIEIEATAVLD